MVDGPSVMLHVRRRAEVLATWPPCPACNPNDYPNAGYWSCATCNGVGRVPPSPPPRTAVATDDGHRRCAYPRCQAGGDILPGAPSVIGEEWVEPNGASRGTNEYHPGCWAADQGG